MRKPRRAGSPARLLGEIAHDVNRLIKKLAPLGDPGSVHLVYEAGPTGYGLQRKLQALGYPCEIIAPSLIPRRALRQAAGPKGHAQQSVRGRGEGIGRFRLGCRLQRQPHRARAPRDERP